MQKSYVSRAGKVRHYESSQLHGPELENHFILRLPKAQSRILREDIAQGKTNIKDRLFIQLDHAQSQEDMRNGIITFDTIMHRARMVDLPTTLETWKTIDGKNFYKTADTSQMLMVLENEDAPEEEDTKKRRRDSSKLDKKYVWPHGYTPPLKNVRKRRFRKVLRKKGSNLETIDVADIEKEVRRLLRTDNETINLKWEVIREDELLNNNPSGQQAPSESNFDKEELFGELSSSEDEIGTNINILDDDEDSRMSVDDSRSFMQNEMANSPTPKAQSGLSETPLITQFTPGMFSGEVESHLFASTSDLDLTTSTASLSIPLDTKGILGSEISMDSSFKMEPQFDSLPTGTVNEYYSRLAFLESELSKLLALKSMQEAETLTIENLTLKQKFLDKLSDLESQIMEKEIEIREIRSILM